MAIKVNSSSLEREFKKQKLKIKVLITGGVLLVAIMVWILLTVILKNQTITNPNLEALSSPFNFKSNQTAFQLLDAKTAYTEEELAGFPIYILNENFSSSNQKLITRIANPDWAGQEAAIAEGTAELEAEVAVEGGGEAMAESEAANEGITI